MISITKENRLTLIYIIIAFLFSAAIRMIWYYQFNDYEPFRFNNQLMINTNDGYYWAEGARDILNGSHQENDLSPVDEAASKITAFFAYILPFSFESVILFMPLFLSSLIVIPIVLIGRSVHNAQMGFIAALLASISHSYYNRTMLGYYDTDMLNIVLPMFLLWSIIWAIRTNEHKYLLITAIDILAYRWWYPQSYSLEFAFFALILFYVLIWDRKNIYNYKLLSIMLIAMMDASGYIRLALASLIFYIFHQEKFDRYIYYILAFSIVAFLVSGGFNPILAQLKNYVFRNTTTASGGGLNLHFYSVLQTVREAGHISFETFASRISGHTITFIISIAGYLYLVYRHRIMLLGLPLVGLGFLAYSGGLRFTIYAVPVLAFGVAFLITEIARFLPTQKLKILSMVTFTLLALYPNITHIKEYKVPTVFNIDEVNVLNKLKEIASREDYVVSWWDYGYPIRYYTDVKTLVDGGKHDGDVNFPVSFMLTNSQETSAKLARLDVEYTEKAYKVQKESIDKNLTLFSNIEEMTKDYGFNNTNDFLLSLQTDLKLPQKTRDIYFYLPYRMLSIYPTVETFSNIDLMSGNMSRGSLFYASTSYKQEGENIDLGSGVVLNLKEATITLGKDKVNLKRFVQTGYDKEMNFAKKIDMLRNEGALSVIYMSSYNTFLVLDEKSYNSLYVQLLVLEQYNKELFEPVMLTPHTKVFKLKI